MEGKAFSRLSAQASSFVDSGQAADMFWRLKGTASHI
jgi:hypothetical protein